MAGVFCAECGPDAELAPDRPGVLRCGRCGSEEAVPGLPLFVVTGASGTGKTEVVAPLGRALPGCEVFDADVILDVAELGWDTFRGAWLRLAHAVAVNGRPTVLCGSLLPRQLEGLPDRRLVGPIHFCCLDCPDEVLAERLARRPAWRGTSSPKAIADQLWFARWLREEITPSFDTATATADEVAGRVAGWVRDLLPGVR